jgi:type IV secretion system protein TrbL
VVLLSFFILAIQLFVTLIEFKLATLAGFILVPFGLFNKTAFMAERVLGLVISSGVKVLVLAVIVGIGSTIFSEFTAGFAGEPTINDAMSVVLGALALLALGIFGPGIANGIVSGGPQLGAGAAVGTGIAVGGAAVAGVAGTRMALGTGGAALRGASAVGSGTATAYQLGAASRSTGSEKPSVAWPRSERPVPSPRSARSGARSRTARSLAPARPMPQPAGAWRVAPCPPRPMTARPTGRAG